MWDPLTLPLSHSQVPEGDTTYLRSAYRPTTVHPPSPAPSTSSDALLYELPPLQMWTKLRPFLREFLEEAAGMFEMYVYTMGEKLYAQVTPAVWSLSLKGCLKDAKDWPWQRDGGI
jgi:hypothetical protein